jgi:hypothetical protein
MRAIRSTQGSLLVRKEKEGSTTTSGREILLPNRPAKRP